MKVSFCAVLFPMRFLDEILDLIGSVYGGFLLIFSAVLRPDFTSKLVRELAFGTPKFYIALYDKINQRLVNMSSNCDVKSGLSLPNKPLTLDQM